MDREVGLCDLPAEALAVIVSYISVVDGVRLQQCCRHLHATVRVAANETEEKWLQKLHMGDALSFDMVIHDNVRWLAACARPWFLWWELFGAAARHDALKCAEYIWDNFHATVHARAKSLFMWIFIKKKRESKFCARFCMRLFGVEFHEVQYPTYDVLMHPPRRDDEN